MLNNENFKEVLASKELAIILISGGGCANCVTMYPLVKEVEKRRDDVEVFYLEIDETNHLINDYFDVEVVPTVLLTHNGELIAKIKGYQPQEIFDIYIDTKIDECKKKA